MGVLSVFGSAIDTGRCLLFFLTAEYDFSCTPTDTLRTAASIDVANVAIMEQLGHFPMSENLAQFRPHRAGPRPGYSTKITDRDGSIPAF
jgi:hypothetical protein